MTIVFQQSYLANHIYLIVINTALIVHQTAFVVFKTVVFIFKTISLVSTTVIIVKGITLIAIQTICIVISPALFAFQHKAIAGKQYVHCIKQSPAFSTKCVFLHSSNLG
jgi:hypothetical protein